MSIPQIPINNKDWINDKVLSGKSLAQKIRIHLKEKIINSQTKPGIAVIIVGEDNASQVYVKNKEKAASSCGFHSVVERLPAASKQVDIIALVNQFNQDDAIHGILVQLPLPDHINEQAVVQSISAEKDADGFHFESMGRLMMKVNGTVPCTPLGIIFMLSLLDKDFNGVEAVVVGRSNIVGKPMAQLLMNELNATVTTCHSRTKNINDHVSRADILVVAAGKRNTFDETKIKTGAVVIDVGIHRTENGLCGDVDFEKAKEKASYITPVPGGVGPMTIALLLYNTWQNSLRLTNIH